MFIFKKLQKQNDSQTNNNHLSTSNKSSGVQLMGQHLQKKFSRGIQYNMKILIRGDRNVGKTCLFYRLQGDKFYEEYVPSEEIKVASIQWNYNTTDDVVKVEIWDVVDKGKKRESLVNLMPSKDALKMQNQETLKATSKIENGHQDSSPALDAEFVDVYKGTNGIIILFDMTKSWTFDYVVREMNRCPLHIPILILANHRDMGHHRVITSDQVQSYIDTIFKSDTQHKRIGQIRYAETSMRNGFGLRYLYKFFNLPFLHLQRATLLKQLDRNADEMNATCQELDIMSSSEEYDYDNFLKMITDRRRLMADQQSALSKNNVNNHQHEQAVRSVSMPAKMSHFANESNNKTQNDAQVIVKPSPSIIIGANNPLPPKFQQEFQNKSSKEKVANDVFSNALNSKSSPVKKIEDFVPDDLEQNIFRKFLDEPSLQVDLPSTIDEEDSFDNDVSEVNPVVAKYQEDLDPEDLIANKQFEICEKENFSQEIILYKNSYIESTDLNKKTEQSVINENNTENIESLTPQTLCDENIETILNCDDIDVLENLYISKSESNSNSLNRHENIDDYLLPHENHMTALNSEESSFIKNENRKKLNSKKNKPNQNETVKTKKKTKKSSKNTNNDQDLSNSSNVESIGNKKNPKNKTAIKSKKNNLKQNSDNILDEERRRLEEFLGSDYADLSKTDQTSYEIF